MKRLLAIVLVVLVLTGCAAGAETSVPTTEETTIPAPTGLYNPNSPAEKQTKGAVRAYPLGKNKYVGLTVLGSKLLLVSDRGELTTLVGDVCEPTATVSTGTQITAGTLGFSVAETGVGYYTADTGEVVLLNPQLQETVRYALPKDCRGLPAINVRNNEVYFSTGHEICAVDLQTQIQRKIRVQESTEMELTGCHFEGKVLSVKLIQPDGAESVVYLSTETGQTLSEDQNVYTMQTEGDKYYLERLDGYVHQRIIGTISDTPLSIPYLDGTSLTGNSLSVMLPEGTFDQVSPVLQRNGLLSYKAEENQILFSFHDLTQGKTTAQVALPQVDAPIAVTADRQYVWIIAAHAGTNKQVLYRWDISKTPAKEAFAALCPLYTPQSPDEEGLKLQKEHADWYSNEYGVKIAIWQDAVKQTGQFQAVPEHQPSVISDMLTGLEPVYPLFPNNILRRTVEGGWIRICLVRSISGNNAWAQFWHNGDCYILLTPEGDIASAFLQAVAYAIDSHVLGNSRDYDSWDIVNPKGFKYDYNYDRYELREDLSLTEGENRAFIDSYSMTYPHEDRCRIFYYAITDGNEEIFASKTMQNKLQKLCEGIREAYGLEKKEDTYKWEQYLKQEMDYSYT